MGLKSLYNKVALISPYMEIMLRHIYWRNIRLLKKYSPYGPGVENRTHSPFDFRDVIDYLKSKGIGSGSLIVVHSSYDNLASCGLKPQEIISMLKGLLGKEGTIAMPAIRAFKKPTGPENLMSNDESLVFEYDVKRTPIISGLLPFTLLRNKDCKISHFPYNPLVAIGPLAEDMMEHNLDGEYPSAHGKMSCWKFCMDHDAVIVGLGVDLEHHNTMAHVMEEAYDGWRWSIDEWYRKRSFDIIDEERNKKRVKVYERKPEWGTLHIAELNFANGLYKSGIIERKMFGDVPVCVERAQNLRSYLQKINKNGYPYFK